MDKILKVAKRLKTFTLEDIVIFCEIDTFKILKKKYPYMFPIVQKMNTLKQPLNTILTDSEQQKKSLKRKIRKDFYKIKQEMGLDNYKLDDLRFCNKIDN